MRFIIVLLSLLAMPVRAQDAPSNPHAMHSEQHALHGDMSSPPDTTEGQLGHGHSQWHDAFYKKLLRPDTKTSCCNLTDCRPTSGRLANGHYEVKVNGAWISVPQEKIIPTSAPDGGYHVCAPINFTGQPNELYCVIVAPEG